MPSKIRNAGDPAHIVTFAQRIDLGLPHEAESKEAYAFISDLDFRENNDYFCFKSGGDGDNGEVLLYLLDAYFASKAARNPSEIK